MNERGAAPDPTALDHDLDAQRPAHAGQVFGAAEWQLADGWLPARIAAGPTEVAALLRRFPAASPMQVALVVWLQQHLGNAYVQRVLALDDRAGPDAHAPEHDGSAEPSSYSGNARAEHAGDRAGALAEQELVAIQGLASQPKHFPWRLNPGGAIRSLDEAIQIARAHGVEIPGDIFLRAQAPRMFDARIYARYFHTRRPLLPDERISWEQFFYEIEGDEYIPVSFNQDILSSDEAIVAVFAHELHDSELRKLFEASGGTMTARQLRALIDPAANGKLHEAAWDEADRLVEAMRRKVPQ